MNRRITTLLLGILLCLTSQAQTWSEWFQQNKTQRKYLLQQIVKLKIYLQYAQKGYTIAREGLTLVSDIKNGDFNLHNFFFNHLKQVSPAVRNYSKAHAIMAMQQRMLTTYRSRSNQLQESGLFTATEMDYITGVFSGLLGALATDIETLTGLLTSGNYEMQDSERLKKIDDLHDTVTGRYSTFLSFINHLVALGKNKQQELRDIQHLQKLY